MMYNKILKRIKMLCEIAEEDGITVDNSSKVNMINFFKTFTVEHKPVITLDDNGVFHSSWRKDYNNKVILALSTVQFIDYVVITPIIYNGEIERTISTGRADSNEMKDILLSLDADYIL